MKYKFIKKRDSIKNCPCGKTNSDGKFSPIEGFENYGHCFSCGKTFHPSNSKCIEPLEFINNPIIQPSFHKYDSVIKSCGNYEQNNLIIFLNKLFSETEVANVISKYKIGTSNYWGGTTVFWQIDKEENVRHGKIMLFNSATGKRIKDKNGKAFITSVRSILKLKDFNLKQCLFGLHIINEPYKKTIALTEGEKTAVLMSLFSPQYDWLATGGKEALKYDLLLPIKKHNIVAFPDKGEYKNWQEKATKLNSLGFKITVNEWLENTEYDDKTDLADVLVLLKQNSNDTVLTNNKINYSELENMGHSLEKRFP